MNSSLISIIEGTYSGPGINGITTIPSGFFAGCTITDSSYLHNITSIGAYAFLNATLPTSGFASISNTINIGSHAFENCYGLQFLRWLSGAYIQPIKIGSFSSHAFRSCYDLTSVNIECHEIPYQAFLSCPSLRFVNIKGYCSIINTSAFYGCSRLSDVTIANPYSLSIISSNAFALCSSLWGITTFSQVSILGHSAFYGCTSLDSVNFNTVSSIPPSCFNGCTALSIASFQNCTSIGSFAFFRCYSLKTLSFPLCETISEYAFEYCSGLANIASTIFPKCTIIGSYAFSGCSSLTYVSMYSVSSVGYEAFWNCSSITTMRISRCLYIGSWAFEKCSKLSSIYINTNVSSQICTLANSNAFSGTLITSTTGRIVVPNALRASYKAAPNWAYFSNRIYSN